MREITLEEAAKVSGGWNYESREVDRYVVHATPVPYDDWDSFFGYAGDSTGISETIGGGEIEVTTAPLTPLSPQLRACDAQADNLVVGLAWEFQLNPQSRERGGVLYLDPVTNTVMMTPVAAGSSNVNAPTVNFQGSLDWLAANSIPSSNILGLVHHHYARADVDPDIERYPVDEIRNDRVGDWESLAALGRIVDAAGGVGALMRTYIIDASFQAREFHLADRANWEALSSGQKNNGVMLPPALQLRLQQC
jgi:hypothetical protein